MDQHKTLKQAVLRSLKLILFAWLKTVYGVSVFVGVMVIVIYPAVLVYDSHLSDVAKAVILFMWGTLGLTLMFNLEELKR